MSFMVWRILRGLGAWLLGNIFEVLDKGSTPNIER
jgi:hypothetical protein